MQFLQFKQKSGIEIKAPKRNEKRPQGSTDVSELDSFVLKPQYILPKNRTQGKHTVFQAFGQA
jgi:hypothetical protein